MKNLPSLSELKSKIEYDPLSGKMFWKEKGMQSRRGGNRFEGKEIGSISSNGYLKFNFNGRTLLCHRVAFYMQTGKQPLCIDHKNRDRTDNRIENLRPADHIKNQLNTGLSCRNESGYKGVYFCNQTGKWKSTYYIKKGKQVTIGRFNTPEEAHKMRMKAIKDVYDQSFYTNC